MFRSAIVILILLTFFSTVSANPFSGGGSPTHKPEVKKNVKVEKPSNSFYNYLKFRTFETSDSVLKALPFPVFQPIYS
jgi:hypothetical protein